MKYDMFNTKYSGHKKLKENASNILVYIILTIISILWILPFVYLIIQSFANEFKPHLLIPNEWSLKNYTYLFKDMTSGFFRWYLNTLIIAIITSVLQTCLVLMTSYAFSRLQFKSRKRYMKLILIIGMFPGFLGMFVNYFILKFLGLTQGYGSLIGLSLIYISGSIMQYYVCKGYFDTISRSLDEAAMLDGANKNTIFWRVIMPLSKPIVVYTLLLAFCAPWGDYMFASVMSAGKPELYNVAVGLQQMLTKENGTLFFPVFCAASIIISIPIVALFFWLQKYYVEGVTGGAVKG